MRIRWISLAAWLSIAGAAASGEENHWVQLRGPAGNGASPHADPPVSWSEEKNVRWKLAMVGRGHSSPIVWGNRIFLTTAIAHGEEVDPAADRRPGEHDNTLKVRTNAFVVQSIDRKEGKVLWETIVREQVPHEGRHHTGSFASASPVTDGERVYAFFGSHGLYCLDWEGKVLWERDLGDMVSKHGHGEGSSPALFGDTIVVNWDHEGPSFVVALDKRMGEERWRKERDEPTSWSTPHIFVHDGRPQVAISAANRIRSYDLANGELIWECGGLSHNVVAAPVTEDGILIAGSSYEKQAMLGIRLEGAVGDITGTEQIVWRRRYDTPYVPSLLLYQGNVYYMRHYQGVLTCLDVKTGEEVYARARLPGIRNVYASPVAASGRIYVTSLDGVTVVFTAGANPETLAVNQLDDSFSASAAVVGKELFLRGEKTLYCIAEDG